jgi:hypothetical protein
LVPRPELAKLRMIDHAVVLRAVAGYLPPTTQPPAPGTLLTAQRATGRPTVYVVAVNGKLYGFASPRQLRSGGFDPAFVVTVPSLGGLQVAHRTAGAAHLDAWSTRADGGIVVSWHEDYVLAGGRALHVPNPAALAAMRREDHAQVVHGAITAADELATMANGTLVSAEGHPYAGVFVAFDGEMLAFSSLGQLRAEGYGGTAAITVPAASAASGW